MPGLNVGCLYAENWRDRAVSNSTQIHLCRKRPQCAQIRWKCSLTARDTVPVVQFCLSYSAVFLTPSDFRKSGESLPKFFVNWQEDYVLIITVVSYSCDFYSFDQFPFFFFLLLLDSWRTTQYPKDIRMISCFSPACIIVKCWENFLYHPWFKLLFFGLKNLKCRK